MFLRWTHSGSGNDFAMKDQSDNGRRLVEFEIHMKEYKMNLAELSAGILQW